MTVLVTTKIVFGVEVPGNTRLVVVFHRESGWGGFTKQAECRSALVKLGLSPQPTWLIDLA
jgi:hypothetical protein